VFVKQAKKEAKNRLLLTAFDWPMVTELASQLKTYYLSMAGIRKT
jgi:hypothetical protein